MSLINQQTLLQARSDRDDCMHRLSIGEDTPRVKELLTRANNRIARLEKQMEAERQDAKQREAAAAAKASAKHDAMKKRRNETQDSDAKPRDFPPYPADMELSCCDCSGGFTFTGKNQLFFQKNNWKMPLRCDDCRDAKKNTKPSGTDIQCGGCKNTFFFSDAKARVFEEQGKVAPKWCSTCKADRAAKYKNKSSSTTNIVTDSNV